MLWIVVAPTAADWSITADSLSNSRTVTLIELLNW